MRIAIAGATGTVGRHAADAARGRGHEVIGLSRGTGHDLVAGTGVAEALAGADAVIDATSVMTLSAEESSGFFRAVTRTLLRAEREVGVAHHVALSIVGIDGATDGYYAGKLAHEEAVRERGVGWSILRAAQFHEFAEQILARTSFGPVAAVPIARVRPVAAREVGAALVEVAEGTPVGRVADLVGPRDESLVDMVRRMLRHDGRRRPVIPVPLPGAQGRVFRSGVLRGEPGARQGVQDFDAWLGSGDRRVAG